MAGLVGGGKRLGNVALIGPSETLMRFRSGWASCAMPQNRTKSWWFEAPFQVQRRDALTHAVASTHSACILVPVRNSSPPRRVITVPLLRPPVAPVSPPLPPAVATALAAFAAAVISLASLAPPPALRAATVAGRIVPPSVASVVTSTIAASVVAA